MRPSADTSKPCSGPPAGIRRRPHSFLESNERPSLARSNVLQSRSKRHEAHIMRTLAAWLLTVSAAGAVGAQPAPAPGYRFDEVRRKVVLTTGKQEVRVDKGQRAHSGDGVQTGFFSYALISSEQHRARFEIFASTDVKLADGTPGVILRSEEHT